MGRYWTVAITVALGVHGGAFALLGVSTGRRVPVPRVASGVDWVGERSGRGQNAINDALDLLDPAPLFLPTRWNAATREASEGEKSNPGEIFAPERARLSVTTGESPPGLVVLPGGVRTAGVAIRRFGRPYFSSFGEMEQEPGRVAPRAGLLDVRSAISGEHVMTYEVPLSAVAESGMDVAAWPGWEPFEVLVAVEPTGILGPPLVPAPGSGVETVDGFFRSYLRFVFRPELRLPAGYYRFEIGP